MPDADAPSFNNNTVIAMRVIVPSARRTGVFTQAGAREAPDASACLNPAQCRSRKCGGMIKSSLAPSARARGTQEADPRRHSRR